MATKIYEQEIVRLLNGVELFITPLKIKYLREFMDSFSAVKYAIDDEDAIARMTQCCLIAMKQYCPIIDTIEKLEDSIDLDTVYKILDVAAGIKMNKKDVSTSEAKPDGKGSSWEDIDLAKLESEAFLIGIWKNFEELEESLSMQELLAALDAKRQNDYNDKKFLAAMQGVDLDEQTGQKEEDPWEAMKARVASGGATSDPNDIIGYQGTRAAQAGFGIGMGLDYETW